MGKGGEKGEIGGISALVVWGIDDPAYLLMVKNPGK